MKPDKIYIDNNLLVRWFLHKLHPKKFKNEPQVIKFLSDHQEIEKYISIVSVAELVRTVRHGDDFQGFGLKLNYIRDLLTELQNVTGLKIISKEKFNNVGINGVVISENIINFVDRHRHLIDCIHVDLAKSHDLFFITHDRDIGVLKEYYEKIMTDDKMMKQYG